MIRFEPDSLLEALVRPIAMALPTPAVYVETIAPDFRFVFALALALAWLGWRVRARHPAAARTLGLFAFCAAAFVPWLATSGNGRYFMPLLLLVGPLCVGLLHHLPWGHRRRASLAGAMLVLQLFLLHEVQPWNSWGLVPWGAPPAFAVDVPQDLRERPATYVTLSGISYSLVAMRFHPDSRWMNLASQQGRPPSAMEARRIQQVLRDSRLTYVVFPSPPQLRLAPQPGVDVLDAIDIGLGEHGLRADRAQPCRLLPSAGLTAVGAKLGVAPKEPVEPRGFWICAAARSETPTEAPAPRAIDARTQAVFERVERLCPRMFPPGTAGTSLLPIGARRFYTESDMRLYVLQDGRVMYKYMRALNPVVIGRTEDVLAEGFRLDCNIRGRAGLPWEREI